MELIRAYIYNISPMRMTGIHEDTFTRMIAKPMQWFFDRSTHKYRIFSKWFEVDARWFRVMVRFKAMDDGTFELDTPVPFTVIESVMLDTGHFRDKQVYHGPQIGSTMGYIQHGVPAELIDQVFQDLRKSIVYHQDSKKKRNAKTSNPFSIEPERFYSYIEELMQTYTDEEERV